MKQINFAAFVLIASLWALAFVTCAVVSGVGLLAFVAGSALVLWAYWRLVVSRPRVAVAGVWEWQQFDGRLYRMEVA